MRFVNHDRIELPPPHEHTVAGSPFCADFLLLNLNDDAVDRCKFEVAVPAHDVEETLEYAGFGQVAQAPELAVPVVKNGWQVAPRRASSNPPRNCFQKRRFAVVTLDILRADLAGKTDQKKRFWSDQKKVSICAPGVLLAKVARRYAMNTNLIHKWLSSP